MRCSFWLRRPSVVALPPSLFLLCIGSPLRVPIRCNVSKPGIAQEAQTGFARSAAYDAYRPSYPQEAVSQLLSALNVANVPGAKVADLAAGTGKFTELLAARPEGYKITAIEPHPDMRQPLEAKKIKGLAVLNGTADDMSGLKDQSVDALIAAQSFHWFANQKALEEIHRVLKPAGGFGMIWNIESYNAPLSWDMPTSWESKVRDLTWTFDDNKPRFRHEKWRQIFDDQLRANPFSIGAAHLLFSLPIGESSVPWQVWLSKENVWKRYATLSHTAILTGTELENTRNFFFRALDGPDVQTDEEDRVCVTGRTVFAWTTKIPGVPLRNGG